MAEHEGIDARSNVVVHSDDEIHVLDLVVVLARYRWLVIGSTVGVALLAMLVSLLITPTFTSTAKIMPPQQQQSGGLAAMLGQLGGLAGAAGQKTSNDLYVGLLESRSVADNLIARFKLKERYEQTTMDGTRRALAAASGFAIGKKDGIIAISVIDRDPAFAATLANAYVDELSTLTQNMALTEAAQRRMFFEKQLKEVKDQLAEAEVALRATQEKTGIVQPEAQVGAIIASVSRLKAEIAAREVQLAGMRGFAAPQNPERLRVERELRGMQAQLGKLEQNRDIKAGDFQVPTGQIAASGVEYVRSLRNVKYYETMFELLAKQYELARADEAKESSQIQLLDQAIAAERKTNPKRALITIGGAIAGCLLGLLLTFFHALYRSSRNNPASQSRWHEVSRALGVKRAAPVTPPI